MATNRTALDIIRAALRKIGVYNPSETPNAADTTAGLEALQDILAEWSTEGIYVPYVTTESFNLAVGQVSYTVGENGTPDKNTVRPNQVLSFFVRNSSNYDYSGEIIGRKEYFRRASKSGVSGRPSRLYPMLSVPNATFYVYPAPNAIEALHFQSAKPFTEPTALTTDVLNTSGIPREYYNAIVWTLACDLAPEFEKEPTPYMVLRASSTKSKILSANVANMLEPGNIGLGLRSHFSDDPSIGDALEY